MDRITEEKVQVLLGERGNKEQSALRRGEMLLNLQRVPTVTADPTAAQFNALVDAYNKLIVALADLARK